MVPRKASIPRACTVSQRFGKFIGVKKAERVSTRVGGQADPTKGFHRRSMGFLVCGGDRSVHPHQGGDGIPPVFAGPGRARLGRAGASTARCGPEPPTALLSRVNKNKKQEFFQNQNNHKPLNFSRGEMKKSLKKYRSPRQHLVPKLTETFLIARRFLLN